MGCNNPICTTRASGCVVRNLRAACCRSYRLPAWVCSNASWAQGWSSCTFRLPPWPYLACAVHRGATPINCRWGDSNPAFAGLYLDNSPAPYPFGDEWLFRLVYVRAKNDDQNTLGYPGSVVFRSTKKQKQRINTNSHRINAEYSNSNFFLRNNLSRWTPPSIVEI